MTKLNKTLENLNKTIKETPKQSQQLIPPYNTTAAPVGISNELMQINYGFLPPGF